MTKLAERIGWTCLVVTAWCETGFTRLEWEIGWWTGLVALGCWIYVRRHPEITLKQRRNPWT